MTPAQQKLKNIAEELEAALLVSKNKEASNYHLNNANELLEEFNKQQKLKNEKQTNKLPKQLS